MAVMNNFGYRMKLESLIPDPPDDRFFHKPSRKQPDVEVEPHKKQKVNDARKKDFNLFSFKNDDKF